MQYKLTIPGRLPGLNELIEAERANGTRAPSSRKTPSAASAPRYAASCTAYISAGR